MKEGREIKTQIKLTYTDGYENGYKQAIKEINTPMQGIRSDSDAQCPRCKHYLVEVTEVNGGFRLREALTERCRFCGQKLKWR